MSNDKYLKYADNKLASVSDASTHPSKLAVHIHSQFRSMILSPAFPCPGAKTAFSQGTYRYGVFGKMGTEETALDLGESLRNFLRERTTMNSNFTTFVASFKEPTIVTHEDFAHNLWAMLQQLHEVDLSQWNSTVSSDPESSDFAFSFAGTPIFIIGLHSGSPRFARRFAWPTMVFNVHEQFHKLRTDGIFEKFRDTVRKNDTELQGCKNPVAMDFGNTSEAIQYTGEIQNKQWKCPFKHKDKS